MQFMTVHKANGLAAFRNVPLRKHLETRYSRFPLPDCACAPAPKRRISDQHTVESAGAGQPQRIYERSMRLSDLLRERREAILQEFEDYARTHAALGTSMDIEALRDHAAGMMEAIELDLEEPQTAAQQERKGKGDANAAEGSPRTAAEEHGKDRALSGFSMEETFAEYRALRASVMRHFVATRSNPEAPDVQDIIRFDEALDQALSEAITEYAQAVTGYREMFLAVLGHDLRSPLNAILGASTFLADKSDRSDRDHRLAATIAHCASTMSSLIDDMLAYTSSQLGQGLSLRPARTDVGEIAADVVREVEVSHPGRKIDLVLEGDRVGEWDTSRLRQSLSNLVTNAVRYAPADSPVTVTVSGHGPQGEVIAAVHNLGAPIPEHERELIFQPFRRASGEGFGRAGGGAGLGLYIARLMAEAHAGTVGVESSAEAGTTFSIRLPRRAPGASGDTRAPA